MKTISAIILSLGVFAAAASAQPVVGAVVNAASFTAQPPPKESADVPLPNAAIAQGSFFAIFGTGLGPDFSSCGSNCIWSPYPLPTTLPTSGPGTSVAVTVNGTTTNAFIYFTSANQINAVLPSTTPAGTGTLVVTYNGTASAAFPIIVGASAFGTFAQNQAGSGPGVILNIASDGTYTFNSPVNSATPGQTIILFGTGLGPAPDPSTEASAPPCPTGCDFRSSSFNVDVYVGLTKATVAYAGRSGFTAEDQINFTVPSGVTGCYNPVVVYAGPAGNQVISNFPTMAVMANGGACADPDGIDYSVVQTALSANGKANLAAISMLSNYLILNLFGSNFQFDNDTVNGEVASFSPSVIDQFQGLTLSPSVGACTLNPFFGFPPGPDPALRLATQLNAGASLNISGPNGSKSVAQNSSGNGYGSLVGGEAISQLISGVMNPAYFLNSSYAISSGTYTVTGSGGSDVGSFSGSIPVSSAAASFSWTNASIAQGAIPRNQDLTLTWTGGDPQGFVDITLIGSTIGTGIPASGVTPGVLIECIANASPGTFTVPSWVLQTLPNTTASQSLVPPGEILIGPASGGVPITPTPSGLDAAYLFYHFIAGVTTNWQ